MEFNDDSDSDEEQLEAQAAIALIVVLGMEEGRRVRNARRRRLYLCRPELLPNPRENTPWQRLRETRNDRAYITTMGIDVLTFDYLLDNGFAELWDTTPIPRPDSNPNGQPRNGGRSLDSVGALGLYLHWINSTMPDTSLVEIFALIPTTVTRYIHFAQDILLTLLRDLPEGAIQFPSGDRMGHNEFEEYTQIIQARHPRLVGAIGTMDGLKLDVQAHGDPLIASSNYNGWVSGYYISNIFVFSPKGEINACCLNAPGSWHDSRVARPIYQKLDNEVPDGYYLVADSAFPRGTNGIDSKIRAPPKSGDRIRIMDPDELRERNAFLRQLVSYRQSVEWGMREIQGSFGRLRIPLDANDPTGRSNLLELCARLHNVRVRRVGIGQIRNVYVPTWRETEMEGLWENFERMLVADIRSGDRVA